MLENLKFLCLLTTLQWNENKIISNLVHVRKPVVYEVASRLLITHKRPFITTTVQKTWITNNTKFEVEAVRNGDAVEWQTANGQTPEIFTS